MNLMTDNKDKKAITMKASLTHLNYGKTTVAPRLKCVKVISTMADTDSAQPDINSGEPLATEISTPMPTE
jgi:hypothetical protein